MNTLALKVYQSGLTKEMKAIALAYADDLSHEGDMAGFPVDYIAWKTGYSRRSVQAITANLVECGVLIPRGIAPNGANIYRMDIDKLPEREPYMGEKWLEAYHKNRRCAYCGASAKDHNLQIDHVIPRSRGGADDASNLVWCCAPCNLKKGASTPEEAGMMVLFENESTVDHDYQQRRGAKK